MYICRTVSELKVEIKGGKSMQVDLKGNDQATLNGQDINYDSIEVSDGQFHIVKDFKSYNVEVVEADYEAKSFRIRVNNKLVDLKVEDRFDLLLHQLGMDLVGSTGVSELKAPMPGLVLDIPVKVGQEVNKDEPLVVLEAMKMENVLKSPADLIVKSIQVKQGEAVEKNQILIEFEN
jgi:biotin carboxyl carrier protein